MKKILIPTDFSETSKNALKYGADLAVALGAQIDILHVFQIPVSVSDSYVYIPDQEEIDGITKAHLAELELIIKEIQQYNPQVKNIQAACVSGIPFEEIKEYSKKQSYDLIIMGEILEHVSNPVDMLYLASTLLDDGVIWLTVPTNAPAIDHISLFKTEQEVFDMIDKAGMQVIEHFITNADLQTKLVGAFCVKK